MKLKVKDFIKDNYKFILVLMVMILCLYIKLPYYAMAPGGVINITDRVEMDGYEVSDGSLNMLYVSEYELTPATYIMAKIKSWEIEKEDTRQVSDESSHDIKVRNKIMRDNSLDIATMVAYKSANKKIEVKNKKNIIIATTGDNVLKVGDVIIGVDNIEYEDVSDVKEAIASKDVGEDIVFNIIRDGKEKDVVSKVSLDNGNKVVGIIITTEYEYDMEPEVDIRFKSSESGASGGLMLTLTIYNAVSDEDIIRGRNIAGTGTISIDGSVGEIDGIKYKIMGAGKNDMDIVFVPRANYDEAIRTKEEYGYKLDIVKVDNFNDAIDYLKNN